MRAVLLDGHGGPETLRIGEADRPVPGAREVLVQVRATSVNRPDIVQRQGHYPPPPGESEILGLEVAGTVAELGEGVTGWSVGDRVMSLVGGGGYAEYARAHASHLLRIPETLDFEQAACVCETYITAYLNVFLVGELADGETVLLHGGGGGVNTAAIQLCRALAPACRIVVTASRGKLDRVRELGADTVIDYSGEDFAEAARRATESRGADVILDHIGADYLTANMKALAVGGRLVVIGVMSGARAEINLAVMMVKRQRIIGSVLRSRPTAEKAAIVERFREVVVPRLSRGELAPVVHQVLPLDEVRRAHETMERSAHFGKIVLSLA